jgi:hypothetical protein
VIVEKVEILPGFPALQPVVIAPPPPPTVIGYALN